MGDRVATIEAPLSGPCATRGAQGSERNAPLQSRALARAWRLLSSGRSGNGVPAIERLAPASVVVLVTVACCYLTARSLDAAASGTGPLLALLASGFIVTAGVSAIAFFQRRLDETSYSCRAPADRAGYP